MTKLEVFDPPLCCSTGVCSPDPDARLARFAADLNWLKTQGVEVRRYNLAQEPAAFTVNPQVKQIVEMTGGDGLPIVSVDGRVVSQGDYPPRERLRALTGLDGSSAAPLIQLTSAAVHAPVFNERIAELVAMGASVAANCESCFRHHHRKATELGVAREDMIQAVQVALGVKEQPAQAMIRLTQKYLSPDTVQTGPCRGDGEGSNCC
jgi:AhpD family alkylhydroperoxidase